MKGLVFHVMGLELYLVSKMESLKGSKEKNDMLQGIYEKLPWHSLENGLDE